MAKQRESTGGKSQLDKFKEAARDLECDDDEQRFKDRLGKLVQQDSVKKTKSDMPSE